MKGIQLKHIKYIFKADFDSKMALDFIEYIVVALHLKKTFIKVVHLGPGFDVFCGLKESHIALSYWEEVGLCIIDIFSCKDFNSKIVTEHIKKIFNAKKVIENKVLVDSVFNLVRKVNG